MLTREARDSLQRVARQLGVERAHLEDEHQRVDLYRAAVERPEMHDLLCETLRQEPDPTVAEWAILELLESFPRGERPSFLRDSGLVLSARGARRAEGLSLRDELLEAHPSDAALERLPDAPDWLQRAVARGAQSASALRILSTGGRTKRVRNDSRRRLRELEEGSSNERPHSA